METDVPQHLLRIFLKTKTLDEALLALLVFDLVIKSRQENVILEFLVVVVSNEIRV